MRSSSKPACSAWKPNMWPKVWASSHFTIGFVKFKPHFGFTKLTVNISKSLVILLSVEQFMAAFFFFNLALYFLLWFAVRFKENHNFESQTWPNTVSLCVCACWPQCIICPRHPSCQAGSPPLVRIGQIGRFINPNIGLSRSSGEGWCQQ